MNTWSRIILIAPERPAHVHVASPSEPESLSTGQFVLLAETFRLLGDPTRLRILMFCLNQPRAVGDIAGSLGLSQTLVSHHLRLLRGARLMRGVRQSRQIFYEVANRHVSDVLSDQPHPGRPRRGLKAGSPEPNPQGPHAKRRADMRRA